MRQPTLRHVVNPALTTFFLTVPLTKAAIREDCSKAMMKGNRETNYQRRGGTGGGGWKMNSSGERRVLIDRPEKNSLTKQAESSPVGGLGELLCQVNRK